MTVGIEKLGQALGKLKRKKPVIHAINNWVTAADVANALHAVGARPIMAVAEEEVEDIVSRADALVLNIGTPDPSRVKAMIAAGHRAGLLGRPIVFDPVGAGVSGFRVDAARNLLSELKITVIRGNAAEIGILSGVEGELAGVDAVTGPRDRPAAARGLSRKTGSTVVLNGPQDIVANTHRMVTIDNGHPMLGQVPGTGCMLSAMIGAFAAVEPDTLVAAAAATAFFGLAGERAATTAKGPGSFKAALLDALFTLTPQALAGGAKIKEAKSYGEP